MEEQNLTTFIGNTVTVARIVYSIITVTIVLCFFIIGISFKTDNATAMAMETKIDLASLRLEREKNLHEYYTNIATMNSNIESMQKQLNRIENKLDK